RQPGSPPGTRVRQRAFGRGHKASAAAGAAGEMGGLPPAGPGGAFGGGGRPAGPHEGRHRLCRAQQGAEAFAGRNPQPGVGRGGSSREKLMNACPSREQLASFLAEQLGSAEEAALETHVEGCCPCQRALAELFQEAAGPSWAAQADPAAVTDVVALAFLERVKK